MNRKLYFLAAVVFVFALAPFRLAVAQQDTSASYAVLMDAESGAVLFEKNGDARMMPASMSKLMSMLLLFDKIKAGEISLEDELLVSEDAWKRGGAKSGSSTMFADPNSLIRLEDLVRGVIVQSANDASIAIAEGIAGSESAFALQMNHRAKELGMENSNFVNSSGWPDPQHYTSAMDLARVARYIVLEQPDHHAYYAEREFEWNGIRQFNRNPLLGSGMGVDGLKTGHTEESGYGLVASARKDGQRLILVVNGLESKQKRAQEARRLLRWGFSAFRPYRLINAGETVAKVPVWHGEHRHADLVVREPVEVVWTPGQRSQLEAKVVYENPLYAPIDTETPVARLIFSAPQTKSVEVPLWSKHAIKRSGMFARALATLESMIYPPVP
ncbi:MAG: D-alanyl-D-alanine carboxypeptidase [Hyphomicrobiales bacterium]|nr:D-alanyl-D-alanine carboxypeptidase [Hyphomicrobiales bacterium]